MGKSVILYIYIYYGKDLNNWLADEPVIFILVLYYDEKYDEILMRRAEL
ncbi:hypothetical protein JOC37_000273 [Desulfohalotomaculum tongense]|nr:hypothetical protein [Desulforadius tongensis]MBM7853908.1 hypothetical protein [Desulforadius tongensis]